MAKEKEESRTLSKHPSVGELEEQGKVTGSQDLKSRLEALTAKKENKVEEVEEVEEEAEQQHTLTSEIGEVVKTFEDAYREIGNRVISYKAAGDKKFSTAIVQEIFQAPTVVEASLASSTVTKGIALEPTKKFKKEKHAEGVNNACSQITQEVANMLFEKHRTGKFIAADERLYELLSKSISDCKTPDQLATLFITLQRDTFKHTEHGDPAEYQKVSSVSEEERHSVVTNTSTKGNTTELVGQVVNRN